MADESEVTTSVAVNWSAFLEQTRKHYETAPAKGLAHGLQKEAIQNGWGARDGNKSWAFLFHLINQPAGRLLTMTDSGTVGLTGDAAFDSSKLAENEPIPSDQRLARFESMFESGGRVGPGLFGRGKFLFNAVSKDKVIYYDTLTKQGSYRFGMRQIKGRNYGQFRQILEGTEAVKQLEKRTGLALLTTPGTRITIVNPIDEVVTAIEGGSFLAAIEETWWEVILKYGATVGLRIDGAAPIEALVPKAFGSLPEVNGKGWRVLVRKNENVDVSGARLRVKKMHFLLPPAGQTLPEDLRGVSLHRQGMKVGVIRLSGIPAEIDERFFGFVQLEQAFEDALAELEDTTHYGFTSLHKAPYRNLRQNIQGHLDFFMEQLGFRKGAVSAEEQTKRLLEDAQSDLNSILNDLGVPGFGSGRETHDELLISVENLTFPRGSNAVRRGDKIDRFSFRVENATKDPKNFWIEVRTFERDAGTIDVLQPRRQIKLQPGAVHATDRLSISIVSPKYPRHKKVACVCELTDAQKRILTKKTFYFFVELEPEVDEKFAQIRLIKAQWPRSDSRRVDYGESIKSVEYRVENVSPISMRTRVRARTLWAKESNKPIADVYSTDVHLSAHQSKTVAVPQVVVDKATYQDVARGKVNLRCHAVALDTVYKWQKGDRLAEHTVSFFLNMDPEYGFFEEIEYFEEGAKGPRSEARPIEGSRSWKFRLNTTHPAYVATEGEEQRRKNYMFEEMTKQTVYVLLRMHKDETLRKQAELEKDLDLNTLEAEDLLEKVAFRITDKVLAAYFAA